MDNSLGLSGIFEYDNGKSIIKKIHENIINYKDSTISFATVRDGLLAIRDTKKNAREAIAWSVGLPENSIFYSNKAPYDVIIDRACYLRLHKED